jgi:zinc protease
MRVINPAPPTTASRATRAVRRRAAALLLTIAPLAPLAAQSAESESALQRRVLPNGLEVIVAPSRGVPLATVELVVRNGAFTQPPEYSGLAHLFEHMFFKANDTYPKPDAFMDRAADLGALFNATTREELVSYYLTVVADSVEGGMHFLNAALRGAQFRADELSRE